MIGNYPRKDALEKVTGRARYTADLEIDHVCHARVLRSPVPHARIRSIDFKSAESLPGVIAVLTGADLAGTHPFYGSMIKDRPLIALEKVRYVGEPVAAVAAEDLEKAELALEQIEVDYEDLPPVLDMDLALQPAAPVIHEQAREIGAMTESDIVEYPESPANLCSRTELRVGDMEKGFTSCDCIFEDTFTFPAVYHYAMEPFACIASVAADEVTVWTSAQHAFVVRTDIAQIFGYPLNRVRVVIPYVGGGFGSKSYTKIEPLVVALARKARRPVRLICSVEEAMYTNRRHNARVWIRTGIKRDGTVLARHVRIDLDTGAYADNGPRVAMQAANSVLGPYRCPHILVQSHCIYTNTTPAGSMRAIGGPQTVWALESQLDRIAEDLRMDALELRRKNVLRPGETWMAGKKPFDTDLIPPLDLLSKRLSWKSSRHRAVGRSGKGIAWGLQDSGASPVSTALVRMHADGSVTVLAATTEIGQGAQTVLSQIAATELSVPMERIRVVSSDTDLTPFDRSTGASRSTTLMGTAVQEAARDLARQLLEAVAEISGTRAADLKLQAGKVEAAEKSWTFPDVLTHYFGARGGEFIGRGYVRASWGDRRMATTPIFYEIGMCGAEVTLDPETGQVQVQKLITVANAGKAINPLLVQGQEEGSAMMALGHTFFEEMKWEGGQLINPNLIDYRVPTFAELPPDFDTLLVEEGEGPGPYGAKGVGEGGVLAVAPAIGNALFRIIGIQIHDLPLTPERVWRAVRQSGRSRASDSSAHE